MSLFEIFIEYGNLNELFYLYTPVSIIYTFFII